MKNINIKQLSNDELFSTYQTVRKQLLNAEIGSLEEMELDTLFTALSKEIENRNIDLKSYKLADKDNKQNKVTKKEDVEMKSVKNIVKGLVCGMVIVTGCLINGFGVNADMNNPNIKNHYTLENGDMKTVYQDDSYVINSDVIIQSIDKVKNTVTFNKDGQLYSFYVDKDSIESYYLNEQINVTMDNKNSVVDCIVDNEPVVYNNVSVIYSDNKVCCVRINNDVYDFRNDGSYKINDRVNIVMQDDNILEVSSCK